MTVRERITNLLKHPLTGGAFIFSALGQIGFGLFDPAWALISATSGYWFPATTVTAATIFPEIGLQAQGTVLLVAGGVVYVMVQLDRGIDRAKEFFENR